MYKYNIYVGKYDKDLKYQVINDDNILRIIYKVMDDFNINCYTIYNCRGVYKHNDSKIVKEPSLNIEIIDSHDLNSNYFIGIESTLCEQLNQESLLITKQEITVL